LIAVTSSAVTIRKIALPSTPYADIAIFRSLVHTDYTGFGGNDDGSLNFRASKKALGAAKSATGYVYVMPRTDFAPEHGVDEEMEWRANTSQRPSQIIKVSFKDLPDGIQIIEEV